MNRHIHIFVVLAISFFLGASIAYTQTLKYIEKIGSTPRDLTWQIQDDKGIVSLTVSEKDFTYTSNYDKELAVTKWVYTKKGDNIAITAERKNNLIKVSGSFKGETINKTLKVNKAPWYQPLSFSLKPFIKSNKKVIIYWTINPRNLIAYRMKAQKVAEETLQTKNGKIKTQKVKVSLAGPKAMFWSSYYWCRMSDGVFVQYKGVDGPPGTPETLTTLTSEND